MHEHNTRASARCAAPAAPAGKLGEAEALCREALAARRETLGDRHPSTLASINKDRKSTRLNSSH